MKKSVFFDPLLTECKSTTGAVRRGEKTEYKLTVSSAVVHYGAALCVRKDEQNEYIPMTPQKTEKGTVWSAEYVFDEVGLYYYRFEVDSDWGKMYIGRDKDGRAVNGQWLPEFQQTVYSENYVAPSDFAGGVIYHVFCDRFCRDESVKADKELSPWGKLPRIADHDGVYRAEEFFGGNFKGIESKLGYLKELGVTVLYLSPIFKAASNHRYDTGDYEVVDPLLGSEEDFDSLVSSARKNGIKIVLDGVFNHTGSDSKYFNKFGNYNSVGAYNSKDSKYYKWYKFNNFPDDYEAWWGVSNVPSVNELDEDFCEMITGQNGVVRSRIRRGIAGWRLDVADELPTEFIRKLRGAVKTENENAIVIGEVWEDASTKCAYGTYRPYLMGDELDSVMNYPFKDAIIEFVKNGDVEKFTLAVKTVIDHYPKPILDSLMNLLGTHDTERILTVLSGAGSPETREKQRERVLTADEKARGKKLLKTASLLEFTLPGVPSVYYGDEAGVEGWADPLNRACYPWGAEDGELVAHYKSLGKMRRDYKTTFANGKTEFFDVSYLKFARVGEKKIVVCVNQLPNTVGLGGEKTDILTGETKDRLYQGEYIVFEEK